MANNNAVILINKGPNVTSFECLRYIKRNVNKKTGHCGTLDKFATGLMIACCGQYTKKVPLFMGMDKTYVAKIEFGKETDTLDPEGEVIKTSDVPDLETIQDSIHKLTGDIMQVPPVYSALHVNGKRSYELVRSGQKVELNARPVKIFSAEIFSYEAPFLTVKLHVSKGTYIRSYAKDLGELCKSCAYVTELCRTSIGPFKLEDAIAYNDEKTLGSCNEETSEVFLNSLLNYNLITQE